jgi:hypothetical protein
MSRPPGTVAVKMLKYHCFKNDYVYVKYLNAVNIRNTVDILIRACPTPNIQYDPE